MKTWKSSQQWWTWIVSFPICLLSVGLYLALKELQVHPSLYLPHVITLTLCMWWGPRVLVGSFLANLISSRLLFPEFSFAQSLVFITLCVGSSGLAWLLAVQWQKIKVNLTENRSLVRFIMYGGLIPGIALTILMYGSLRLLEAPLPTFNQYFFSMLIFHLFGTLIVSVPLLMTVTQVLHEKNWLCEGVTIYPPKIVFWPEGHLEEKLQLLLVTTLLVSLSFIFPLNTHWYIFAVVLFFASTRLRLADTLILNSVFIFVQFFGPFFKFYPALTLHYFDGKSIDGEITLTAFLVSSLIISTALANLKDEVQAHKITEARLQDASIAKSEFLARMSHEIRTPLNAILGMIDLLRTTTLNEEQKRYIQSFSHAGENLQALINDILDISKIEARQVRIESVPFHLRETVKNVFEVLEQRAESKGLLFTFQVEESTPDYLLNDPTRIRQILLNLLSNSLKFTDKGFVQLSIREHLDQNHMPVLLFEISDSGIGIPKDKQNSLFQSFTQADSTIHRRYGGTGLGLAICKNLVELMGGRIWLESQEGKGTRFYFELPYKLAPIRKLSLTKSPQERFDLNSTGKVFKVMIVDDSEDNLLLLRHFMKTKPIELTEARNGKEAVEKYSQISFDIILMDIQMPVLDGHEATQKIRQIEKETGRKYIPILALSANALAEEINKSLSAGCNEHLVKPVSKLTLDEALNRYLS